MTAPRRRWSFGLRTLFVVVTVLACLLAYPLNWIRQRHYLLRNLPEGIEFSDRIRRRDGLIRLCCFGHSEKRRSSCLVLSGALIQAPKPQLRQLFPEAEIDDRESFRRGSHQTDPFAPDDSPDPLAAPP